MKNLLLTIVCFISMNTFAQDAKLILGTWEYSDLYEKEKVDPESLKMTQQFLNGMTLVINKTTMTLNIMGKSEDINWAFSETNPKIIDAKSKTGKQVELEIISLDEKQMILKMGTTEPMILKRKE